MSSLAEENSEDLVKAVRDGLRLEVTINRPAKRNALSRATLTSLRTIFERNATDENIRIATLTGAGEKSFAAGGDLNDLSSLLTSAEAVEMSRQARSALDAIRTFPVPVIAVLNGDALGGGAELAVACDMRIAESHAHIGFVHGRLAITTSWGGGIDLPSIVGPSCALALLSRADVLTAAEAKEIGLVDVLVESHGEMSDAVTRFIAPMLTLPRRVLAGFIALNLAHRRGEGRQGLEFIETERFAETWVHEDHWSAAKTILTRRVS